MRPCLETPTASSAGVDRAYRAYLRHNGSSELRWEE